MQISTSLGDSNRNGLTQGVFFSVHETPGKVKPNKNQGVR